MRSLGDVDLSLDVEGVVAILEAAPVRTGILFGSWATDETHTRSDVDIAVELEELRPGDDGYNRVFFGLSADLSQALETDDVDLVDLHSCPPSVVERILEDGVLLLGDPEDAETLRRELTADVADERSPRERLDESLARIDEHLA